jgi:hypothetical protein
VIESRDYLLAIIERAAQALAALVADVSPAARPEQDDPELERALDDILSGLDSHAHRLAPETLYAVLHSDEKALAFAVLQARKGLRLHRAGEPGGVDRLRCAHDLLALLAARPGRIQAVGLAGLLEFE